jgi:Putative restriction endonuclease
MITSNINYVPIDLPRLARLVSPRSQADPATRTGQRARARSLRRAGAILDDTERHPGPDDVALLIKVAYASLADDHKLAAEVYGPSGIPVSWIVEVNGRRVEVDTGPGPHGYGPPAIFAEGQSVPVVIDGREAGRIAVADIRPPPRPRAEAGGDAA